MVPCRSGGGCCSRGSSGSLRYACARFLFSGAMPAEQQSALAPLVKPKQFFQRSHTLLFSQFGQSQRLLLYRRTNIPATADDLFHHIVQHFRILFPDTILH